MKTTVKKNISTALKIAISAGIITYIFKTQVNINQLLTYFKTADIFWLFVGLITLLLMLTVGIVRWNILLQVQKLFIDYIRLIRFYAIGLFFNLFMVGLTGGDVFKMFYVIKHTKKPIEAGITVVMDRIVGVIGLVSVVFVAVLFTSGDSRLNLIFWPVIGVFTLMCLSLFILMNKKLIRSIPLFDKIKEKLPLKEKIIQIYHAIYLYKSHKKEFIQILIISFLVHPAVAFMNFAVAKAIGITEVPLLYYFVLIPVISFISALPISVAGWGVGEALYVTLFGMFGVPPDQAVSLSIIFKLYYIFIGVVCGLAYVLPGRDA